MLRWLVAYLLVSAVHGHAEPGDWERIAAEGPLTIEARHAADSPVREIRITGHSTASPAIVMDTLWKHEEYLQFVDSLRALVVLAARDDEKLVYEQIHVPLLSDRDLTVRVTRRHDAARGVYEMTSVSAPDEGPPPSNDFVRVRMSEAHWRVSPAADHGSDIVYRVRSDGGGSIPAWLVNTAQTRTAPQFVRAILQRAEATAARPPETP